MVNEYREELKADVLKVGHHGSSSSSCSEFLTAVSPVYAVISVGKDNPYGHPSPEVIERLANFNIKVLRTDLNGTIIFQSDGSDISLK